MTQPLSRTRVAIARLYREHPAKFWLRVSVVTLAVILFVVKRNFWTPDTLFVVLLVLAVAFGKARRFLVRFVPFIGLLLVYDSFRGIADDLNKSVHFTEMIVADRALFGGDANACIGRISPGLSS